MARYILIYENYGCPECGNGLEVEFFSINEQQKMHERVNELALKNEKLEIIASGLLNQEFQYNAVEVIKEYRPSRKLS